MTLLLENFPIFFMIAVLASFFYHEAFINPDDIEKFKVIVIIKFFNWLLKIIKQK